ncbi:MAG: acyl-CoA synthetase (NDP forming) [Gammaproteobacteria bacterium]|jgi:acyl-CoA synthetase (NDP forming)
MTPKQRKNLLRLLKPRHIAFIGGTDAETALRSCQRIGFSGDIWPVNPRRDSMCGLPCYQSIEQLPDVPDAVFLAVPTKPAIDIVRWLAEKGAGGVVCYTAGFGSDGKEGGASDQPLVEVAGDMAIVGPNCYGVINFMDRVALWPFAHGGFNPGYGAAIITQSGMLSSDITMNQRSVPLAYMVSAGNQSVLRLEDYIDVMCELDEVRAIGLHIEGLKDIESFSRIALKALELNKPIVVLKTGTSKIGGQLTISHTGSLSGTNELYQALFDRLSIISVTNPAQLLETLKLICVSGIPKGNRLMGFTCSGGGATMLADYAEELDLEFPQPTPLVETDLIKKLPAIANVTNPLDYTTPIWGIQEKVTAVFEAAFQDNYDAAIIVQDYPLPDCDESKPFYLNDAKSFIHALSKAGIPGILCSTLSENIDQKTREFLIENHITPAQGIIETLNAIGACVWYHSQRPFVLNNVSKKFIIVNCTNDIIQIDEHAAKTELGLVGINVPESKLVNTSDVTKAAQQLGFPVALKLNSQHIAHKTEIGAVAINLNDRLEVGKATLQMQFNVANADPTLNTDSFLVEKMQPKPLAELMVNIRHDSQFGMVMTLSSGGVLIELLEDAVTMILPAFEAEILYAINQLKISKILNGYRGSQSVDKTSLVNSIKKIIDYVIENKYHIAEIEINPLFVYANETYAVDVLMQVYQSRSEPAKATAKLS